MRLQFLALGLAAFALAACEQPTGIDAPPAEDASPGAPEGYDARKERMARARERGWEDGKAGRPVEARALAIREVINQVLEDDHAAGQLGTARETAQAMGRIDLDAAPPDFRTAYTEHVYAWATMAKVESALAALPAEGAAQSTLPEPVTAYFRDRGTTAIRTGEDAERQLAQDERTAQLAIESTWMEVLRVARGHGARAPSP